VSGFQYKAEFVRESEEKELAAALNSLPLKPFEFHGHVGNPAFLDSLSVRVAQFAGYEVQNFKQIGINEYKAGAGIGWHRDKPEFGDIVGISLLSSCKMRFRNRSTEGWVRQSYILEPRSVYLLSGGARQVWEHSIPPVASLRFSLTFRTLAFSRE
jgi:alkylated DNA repair dioxygenase AlkB